jgi:hypothetical protein
MKTPRAALFTAGGRWCLALNAQTLGAVLPVTHS